MQTSQIILYNYNYLEPCLDINAGVVIVLIVASTPTSIFIKRLRLHMLSSKQKC